MKYHIATIRSPRIYMLHVYERTYEHPEHAVRYGDIQ